MSAERKFFVGGNFKMNGNLESLTAIADRLNSSELDANVEVVIAPPACYLASLSSQLAQKENVNVSAENVHQAAKGAFTGEISCSMALDCGARYAILGHSERRHVFGEDNKQIGEKTKATLAAGLVAIACIGEKGEDRKSGNTMVVCVEQLTAFKDNVDDWSKVVIAYEPVWAIGTGEVATPEIAQETHLNIRSWLSENVSPEVAASVRIIYGGSVNGANCKDLASQPDIDGFLVGGASLKPDFVDIINCNC